MASLSRFLYQNLFLSPTAFASVSTYFSHLFGFIITFFLRLRRDNASLNKNPNFKEDYKKESTSSEEERGLASESEAFKDASEFPDSKNNGEVQKIEFGFTFRFPTYEEFCKSREEKGEFVSANWMPSTCNHKSLAETEVVETEDLKEIHSKSEAFNEEEKGNSGNLTCDEEEMERSEGLNSVKEESNITDEFLFESEKDSLTDSDNVSIGFEHIRHLMNKLVDQYSDGFLTDEDFGGEFEHNEKLSDFEMSEENQEYEDSDSDIMEELRKLEHDQAQQFLSEDDFQETVKLRNEDANDVVGTSRIN